MQIYDQPQISNFKGQFIQNKTLQKAMQKASKKDLNRFLQLQKDIESVDDQYVYNLVDFVYCVDFFKVCRQFSLYLNRGPHVKGWTEKARLLKKKFFMNRDNQMNRAYNDSYYRNVLKKVCSIVEDDYPQFASKSLYKKIFHKPTEPYYQR